MKFYKYILLYFLLCRLNGFSQDNSSPFRIWALTSISGEARVKGTYREYNTNKNYLYKPENDYYLNGMLHVNTKSYFVHPNFMLVDFSGTLNPITRKYTYIGIPDYSENYNSEGLDFSALFFSKKRVKLTTTVILNSSIQNIENITRVNTNSSQLGASINYTNNFLPLTIGYSKMKLDQKIVGTDRIFNYEQKILQSNATKSFSSLDHHSLSYLRTENISLENSPNINNQLIRYINTIDLFELNDDIAFDKEKKYVFSSSIVNSTEKGIIDFKRFYANEILTLKLPKNLTLSNSYNLWLTEMEVNKITYQGTQSFLSHKLFESLYSKIFFEYNRTDQNNYSENRNKLGVDLRYVKLIPKGKITLSYTFYREFHKVESPPSTLQIVHSDYVLADNQMTLLKHQNINIQTVIVKDVTGTIIYQLNIDYILIDKNPYIEIVRVPGGLIANNATVYIDYTTTQPGFYDYSLDNTTFSADALLFENKLNLYYRTNSQDYNNQKNIDNLVFNYYTRQILGARLDFYFIKGGVEYENYKSSIFPYHAMNYYINLQRMYSRINFTLNGNLQNTYMINEIDNRQDIDVSLKIAYTLFNKIKLDFDYIYRNMKGRGIDVDVTISKIELTTNVHRLFISLGAELYWNNDKNNQTQFKGTYLQLTRNF